MALQSSGAISLDDIHVEAGGTTGTLASINDSDIRDLINKTADTSMAFNEWYGASSYVSPSLETSAIFDLSSFANGSAALKVNDGVNSQTFTKTSATQLNDWIESVSISSAAGRDIVVTFIIKDADGTARDNFYIAGGTANTSNWSFVNSNASLTTVSGTVSGTVSLDKTLGELSDAQVTSKSLSSSNQVCSNITGDPGEIYQLSVKFTGVDSGHLVSGTNMVFQHEDDDDNVEYVRQWKIDLS